jgi:hypothetical protein
MYLIIITHSLAPSRPIINITCMTIGLFQASNFVRPPLLIDKDMGAFPHIAPIILAFLIVMDWATGWPIDPTQGFIELPLNTSNFHIQKPYDLPISSRYSYLDGIHKLWVYSTDNPLSKNSPTKPRTEILISVKSLN